MRLKVILGRDRIHVPIVSDVLREATGQIFAIRVQGTPAYPKFTLEPLPTALRDRQVPGQPTPPPPAANGNERPETPVCGMT